jgi:hypothetical protein
MEYVAPKLSVKHTGAANACNGNIIAIPMTINATVRPFLDAILAIVNSPHILSSFHVNTNTPLLRIELHSYHAVFLTSFPLLALPGRLMTGKSRSLQPDQDQAQPVGSMQGATPGGVITANQR